MAYLVKQKNRWWVRVKENGKWVGKKTPYLVSDGPNAKRNAKRYADAAQRQIDARGTLTAQLAGPLTVALFAKGWVERRQEANLDWRNDESRLRHHILPTIGEMAIGDVRARHIADLIRKLRFPAGSAKRLAQRTIYNIYSVVSAMFRDAAIEGVIEQTPCILTEHQLGPLIDKDPEWRASALFTRDEVERIISHPDIPADRRLVYAFGFLAGMRPGEISSLRWRHYDPTVTPLGALLVARAYNTRKHAEKGTKTDTVKRIPVHATLAAMLAEWKLGGWTAMFGRAPEPDDLILPLPPDASEARRSRDGEPFRGHDYSGKRWRNDDLPALGIRHRRIYDGKATFVTLAIDDGADPDVIKHRITHTKRRRSAFDGYDRGPHWEGTCRELSKLRIQRRRVIPDVIPIVTARNTNEK